MSRRAIVPVPADEYYRPNTYNNRCNGILVSFRVLAKLTWSNEINRVAIMASTSSTLEDSVQSMDISTVDLIASERNSEKVFFRFDPPNPKLALEPSAIDPHEFDRVQSAMQDNFNRQLLLAFQEQALAIRQHADTSNAVGMSQLWSSQIEFF